MNVPAPVAIQPDQGKPKYAAYQKAVQYFKYSTNTSADPCDDFYGYVCGNYKKADISFHLNDATNYGVLVEALDEKAASPVSTI